MAASKFSISLSRELEGILTRLAKERSEERSRLIETLLRETPLVQERIRKMRATAMPLKKGRSVEKLRILARIAEAEWRAREASGRVKYLGPRP